MNRKISVLAASAALTVTLLATGEAWAWPWSTDMVNQPSIKPQEQTRAFPRRSVPVTGIPSSQWADRDATQDLANPIAASEGSLKQGKLLFNIYCTACHGKTGRADTEVVNRGMPAPDLTDSAIQDEMSEGWLFGTITFGSAAMPPYGRAGDMNGEARGANDLSVEERWHVVNYIKHQLVKDAEAAGPVAEAK